MTTTATAADTHHGQNEKTITRIKVRPAAIKVRKDEIFTNARSQFPQEPLESLEKSIQELGLLKQLTVERDPGNPNEFFLLAGERRHICLSALVKKNAICRDAESEDLVEAAILYEFVDVKIVAPRDDIDRLAIMLAENGEHSAVPDWDYFNFALYLSNQKKPDGSPKYSRPDLCRAFNKSSPWITHTLQLADLPDRVKASLKDGSLSRTAAIQLLSAKENQVEFVLKYTEDAILRAARKEIEDAEKARADAELDVECAEAEEAHALTGGDRIAAKLAAKRASAGKKKVRGAVERKERAEATVQKPVLTDDSLKQTFAEQPHTLKPGVAAKPRSPRVFRDKIKEIRTLLDAAGGKQYIVNTTSGKHYNRDDLHLIVGAWEQFLGVKSPDVFDLLDEEYERRDEKSAA